MDNLERYQTMISKAVNCAKEHHKVIFYTDAETLPYLNITGVDIKLIETTNFYFVDDFKVHLLSIISDEEVLIDTLILSNCDYLLRSRSAVSDVAIIFNENIKEIFV
jgi:hypothetical protein